MFRIFLTISLFFLSLPLTFASQGFVVESIGSTKNTESRKRLVENVLSTDSMYFGYSALSIILDAKLIEPRWQLKGRSIRLSSLVKNDSEFLKLLVHELGHYVDIYNLISFGKEQDPSSAFYAISWESSKTKKSTEWLESFISWYAATNQWEDFAESFTFYIFHNDEFADRALKNESLRQKYLFFSNVVFSQWAFIDTDFVIGTVPAYIWDTTKIPVSVKKYLYFIH
jgi:hypothetical protein